MMVALRLSIVASIALMAAALAPGAVFAQASQPFDMSGERSTAPADGPPDNGVPIGVPITTQPAAPSGGYVAPLQVQPSGEVTQPMPAMPGAAAPQSSTPSYTVPNMVPSLRTPVAPAQPSVPSVSIIPPAPVAADTPSAPAAAPARLTRYIVPESTMRLEGEIDQRSWSIFLTADEAARSAEIEVAYKNAILVMPEASRLRVLLNGEVVLETPLASSEKFNPVTAAIPSGLLRAGANVLNFQAFQRHRTDCSIQSTYELWTDIDPSGTKLNLEAGGSPDILQSLEDLPAVGFNAKGITAIHFVVPGVAQGAASDNMLKLAQAIGVLGGYANPAVTVTGTQEAPDSRGTLTVLLGTADNIVPMLSTPITSAATQPVVTFVDDPRVGASVLVVTGANWGQVGAAVDAIAARADRPLGQSRLTLNTASWLSPDVHYFTGREAVPLNKLGIGTQQFSGRRFRAQFAVGVPSDFYAESYGEATLLLDAAYTSAVLPASHLDIYVNGQIAATTRIVNRNGGIFRHLPVQIPFRHFHPGVNIIMIEAALNTEADLACAPGGSIAGPDRFVLFDTTEFSMPNFARIARRPNLSAFAGSGFPYNIAPVPSALVLGRTDIDTLSAAGTLVSRLAIQAGRIVPLTLSAATNVGNQPTIFVGVASQFSDGMLGRLGIAETVRVSWKGDVPRPPAGPDMQMPGASTPGSAAMPPDQENTDAVFDRWRTQLAGGGGWRGQVSSFEDWMKRNFDISFSALRIGPAPQIAFEPKAHSTLLLAQAASPNGNSTWTMMTAPSGTELANGAASVAAIRTWSQVGGQYSAFSAATGLVENRAVSNFRFVVTQPLSLQNLRLIAANWFSSNIVSYAVCLIFLCLLLGMITSGLLFRLGRPS
ncbi:cellulose biosynthesis cyclic di-GMP-binding regulatory protein BcsB [Mesorhizobium sp. BR1-1-16]|uniref:cellulose biosynthesis cyclic di-GMP-binding regulatory protein BcsB n=1 Tax=Mesorhizobium sp. BR1-1-16 TaxID=2876653 RepID=UPI001CCAAE1B|nr:cellulose biosynthesis cyclic di-GMP-binding regulatory protein BcsB [Mesorhizobium sp. BR1-1-16]MBZ9937479.1 cellulose biosynthesis cyclic di-GMP-binding regulatory protein BcsB [Mesorhizobium sp. BR1-1-16]